MRNERRDPPRLPGDPLEERARAEGNILKDFSGRSRTTAGPYRPSGRAGHAPLYLDRLTWGQLCEIRWSAFSVAKKSIRWTRKIPKVLGSIQVLRRRLGRYFILFLHSPPDSKGGGLVGIGAKRRATGRGSDRA